MSYLPQEFKSPLEEREIAPGVKQFIYGNDGGLAVRFFTHAEYNFKRSKELGLEFFDELEMLEIVIDKGNIMHRPATEFDKRRYAKLYESYRNGKMAHGTLIRNWDVLSMGEQATLEMNGVFTVEQFAELADQKFEKLPGFKEKQERAKQHIRAKSGILDAAEYADRLADQGRQIEELKTQLAQINSVKPDAPKNVKRSVVEEAK